MATSKTSKGRVPSNYDIAGFVLSSMYPLDSDGLYAEILPQSFSLPPKPVFAPYSLLKANGTLSYPDLSLYPLDATIIHFYLDDWRFESAWRSHTETIERLDRYYAVISPDFSVHFGAPLPPNLFNLYRNRLLTRHWQEFGLRVIFCLSWGFEETFEFCFSGIPTGSIVSVKSCGDFVSRDLQDAWMAGFKQLCDQLQPSQILCCNKLLPQAFEYLEQQHLNIPIIEFPHYWSAKRVVKSD